MCEVTGGRSYRIKSHYVLNQCIESLVQKVQPGVVVQFEQLLAKDLKDGEVQDLAFPTTKKMIYVAKHPTQKNQFPVGFWPIPEPYWPDPKALSLPPRDAHPKIRIITPCVDEPPMVRNFPVDKYEVEASPLTLQILSKREANKCWPVVISNGNYTLEQPFGYLKTCPPFTQVFLIILPYNYPVLLPLVNELLHKYNSTPPPDWVYKFSVYFRQVPPYYGPFLRRALNSASVPFSFLQYILPENLDNYLSSSVANYLKTMKNTAKQEQENMCLRVLKQLKMPKPPFHQVETAKLNCGLPLKRDLVSHPQLRDTFSKVHSEINIFENYTIVVPSNFQQGPAKNYRNPFDVPRHDLIDEIARMRDNFYKLPTSSINVFSKDAGHCLPISEMGNYQEYLKNKETPLREIEPTNVRQHMFGNPYKKDKHMVMVDEADLSEVMMKQQPNANPMVKKVLEPNNRLRKRKAGPIRKDYIFRRLSTDSNGSDAGSMISASSCQSSMDTDDTKSVSSAASVRSDDDDGDNELVIDFGFNDSSSMDEDFTVNNGHVQSFINGDLNDDTDETSFPHGQPPPPPAQLQMQMPSHHHHHPIAGLPHQPPTAFIGMAPYLMQPPNKFCELPIKSSIDLAVNSIANMQAPQVPQIGVAQPYSAHSSGTPVTQQNGSLAQTNVILSTPSPTSVPQTLSFQTLPSAPVTPHNDLNDAQEISKILQQCHNGSISGNSSSGNHAIPTNNNINNNNNMSSNGNNAISFDPITSYSHGSHKNHNRYSERNINDIDISPMANSMVTPLHLSNHTNSNDVSAFNNEHTHHKSADSPSADPATATTNDLNTASTPCEENGTAEPEDDEEQKENIKQNNLNARKIIFQDIRRPGRDYSLLLEHLNLIKGSLETKLQFIQMCIEESQRFRRKKMADCIQEWWDKYVDKTNHFNTIEFATW